ncbi:hypothetical protein [Caulobacter phage Cr30]|uniref:hypothetical protein n=1 Tax=Caulobacter phage Cr30 TaxID=1357714 RepID=UPI0004A9B9F3|nr:hypothetical protein OZ74_gp220 [Caulobacter phage Cr30]AGS81123.1 hypothetical protein [Caulobacter phage Cr30]
MTDFNPQVGDQFLVKKYGEDGDYLVTVVYVKEEYQDIIVDCPEIKRLQIMSFWSLKQAKEV